ncbi:MAG: DUF4175 family protein [Planctomycetaceae bacterium]
MSDITLPAGGGPVSEPIQRILGTLRRKLRRYSVISGAMGLVIATAAVFWTTTGLDAAWFAVQKLELPVGLRVLMLAVMAAAGAWLLGTAVVWPLIRRVRDRDLALLLERRFPEFRDGLLTALEDSRTVTTDGEHSLPMLQRTIRQTAAVADQVSVQDVFDLTAIRKTAWIAGLLALSVVGCGLASPQTLKQWWAAFVKCESGYHVRETQLQFAVRTQPGDRVIPFRDENGIPTYRHGRGSDLDLEITVPPTEASGGAEWVVPDRVRVDVIREDGTRSRTYVSSATDQSFRFVLTRLQESVAIEVLGGDYRTSVPLQVLTVDPPGIDGLEVECDYPDYTGWNEERERKLSILSSEVALPMGTRFTLTASSSKALQSAQIITDVFELSGNQTGCRIVAREGFAAAVNESVPLISADGRQIRAAFHLTASPGSADKTTTATNSEDSASALPDDVQGLLTIASNTTLKFVLHDQDDIFSASPDSLRVRGIADKAPVIAVRTNGISNAITRRAVIPMVGRIEDDYGLASAGYRYIVDDQTEWGRRPFRNEFRPGMEYELQSDGERGPELFAVQELDLSDGQTLALTVVAEDRCTVPEPNTSRAEPTVFRIVSEEELLSLLYSRELTLRRRFESVIQHLTDVHQDLEFHRKIAERADGAGAAAAADDRAALNRSARTGGDTLRSQTNELLAITESFQGIVDELSNNSVPTSENMLTGIVKPLQTITQGKLVTADRAMSRFRVAAGDGQPVLELLQQSSREIADVITELKTILENVRTMAEFHEALSDLKNIIEEQQRILDETKREQIRILGL